MKAIFPGLITLAILLTVGVAALAAPPTRVAAQLEETPILGPPIVITPLITAVPEEDEPPAISQDSSGGARATPTATTPVGARPDRCEPNNTPAQPCPLPLDAVSGPFTIVPEDDQDFFQLDLPQEAAIQTTVTIRATYGLDLILSASQGAALLASSPVSLTLAPSIAGPVILRVENRDPRPATGETYRIEVRRSIAPPNVTSDINPGLQPDALENNWSFTTASPIAVGVVYDLSLVCPEPRLDACPGGDHDYLLVPVKAGVPYLIATFDLDAGVDTVVEVFWRDLVPTTGSDDYGPGGMLSALTWTAPADGLAGIRVAPRNGGLTPRLEQGAQAGYRFVVAPVASELAQKLEATVRDQANLPTPTALAATAAPASSGEVETGTGGAAGAAGTTETIASGPAIIVRETVLRRAPDERSTALATLPSETLVTVRGPVSGLWVSVETEASILPGWVRWSDLQREAVAGSASAPGGSVSPPVTSPVSGDGNPPSQQPDAAVTPRPALPNPTTTTSAGQAQVTVTQLDPALPPSPAAPVARVPLVLTIVVAATDRPPIGGSALGFATPTPDLRQPVKGVRVQLLTVFGDVLAEGLTDTQGAVTLSRDVRPSDALRVRMPAWGVELPLAADQTNLVVTIPEAHP